MIRRILFFISAIFLISGFLKAQPNFPTYDISVITTSDAIGTADSFNVICEINGIAHGIDFNGAANQINFMISDSTGAIWISGQTPQGPPYAVTEGDSLRVRGRVRQTNGLTFFQPLRFLLGSQGNTLDTPIVVTSLDENIEARLIRFNQAKLVNASAWTNTGAGFTVEITNGSDTVSMRIDNDSDLFGTSPPLGFFDAIGIVSQFDNALPLFDGYFFQPRYQADLINLPIPALAFDPSSQLVWESGGSIDVSVSFVNATANSVSVDLKLDSASTANNATEFLWNDTTITFPANATQPIIINIPILDDLDVENNETIVINLENPTGGIALGASPMTITIRDDEYPAYPITNVTTVMPQNGIPDSIGVRCKLTGIVYGINLQNPTSGNLQFVLIDSTGGIMALSGQNFGYSVQEGDEISVKGTIFQNRGATNIAIDSLFQLSSGNPLISPAIVTQLNEPTESELIKLEGFKFIGPWNNNTGNSFNTRITNNTDTLILRVYNQVTDIYAGGQPSGWVNITGLGGQLAGNRPPFNTGYHIFPRYLPDLQALPNPTVAFDIAQDTVFEAEGVIRIPLSQIDGNPDPTDISISLISSISTATEGSDFNFSNSVISLSGLGFSGDTLEIPIVDDMVQEGAEEFVLLISQVTNNATISQDAVKVVIMDGMANPIEGLLPQEAISLYPNPSSEKLRVSSLSLISKVNIFTSSGVKVGSFSANSTSIDINASELPAGFYLIQVESTEGQWFGNWVKQ